MYVLGAPCCQQIQKHQKLNIKLNSTFGTFSGICPWPFSWLGFFAPILAQNNNCSFFLCPLVLHCPFWCFKVDWNPEQVRTDALHCLVRQLCHTPKIYFCPRSCLYKPVIALSITAKMYYFYYLNVLAPNNLRLADSTRRENTFWKSQDWNRVRLLCKQLL